MYDLQIIPLGDVHSDERRAIHESDLPEEFRLVRVNRIAVTENGSQRLGDHHHDVMTEWFVLAVGKAELLVVSRSDTVDTFRDIEAPCLIKMPTGVDHTFVLAPGTVILTLSDKPFDTDDIFPASKEYMDAVERLTA